VTYTHYRKKLQEITDAAHMILGISAAF